MDEGVPIWTKWLLSNCWWRNLNHFAKCSKFEQPLHQIVTRREKWSTSAGSGWPRGFSLVVQVSGGALTRTSSVAPSIKIKSNFRGNRVDTIFGAGFAPCSFFGAEACALLFFRDVFFRDVVHRVSQRNGYRSALRGSPRNRASWAKQCTRRHQPT